MPHKEPHFPNLVYRLCGNVQCTLSKWETRDQSTELRSKVQSFVCKWEGNRRFSTKAMVTSYEETSSKTSPWQRGSDWGHKLEGWKATLFTIKAKAIGNSCENNKKPYILSNYWGIGERILTFCFMWSNCCVLLAVWAHRSIYTDCEQCVQKQATEYPASPRLWLEITPL